MSFKLEDLPYQRQAIDAVVRLFEGQQRNYFDLDLQGDCFPNKLLLSRKEIIDNVEKVIEENGISHGEARLCLDPDYCVEMETGTGKTLVYLRTIYELSREYGFTKFIILVPSVPIREGVLDTIESFRPQLERLYNIPLHAFEYDSKKLTKVKRFIEGTDLQVMVMTTHSFSADDNIINRPDRDDSPDGYSYWQALSKVRPIVIMDEPQEGMDTENLTPRLNALDPVARLRYSATHKVLRNMVYRLSPFDAYNQQLVKKIEVLSVAEINDEATLKIELTDIQTGNGAPKAKLKAWRQMASGFKYAETKWLKSGDSLEDATKNVSYRDFKISQIRAKGLRGPGGAMVKFSNGVELTPNTATGDIKGIFRQQLYWLCYRHFQKVESLKKQGIKPLSLIFIDRVANYMEPDGIIRTLFIEEFPKAYRDHYGEDAPEGFVHDVQAYYFAKTNAGEFTDSENSMAKQREIYDEILRDKEALLAFDNPRQFIFSHSALGVGWDNPNVFNIATLNQTYSDVKKRQEIGRGLRICRNQSGERVYDSDTTPEGEETNLLTVIPNESYQTFVTQYQSELGSHVPTRHSPKGKPAKKKKVTLNKDRFKSDRFQRFWKRLAQRTDYSVSFDEAKLVADCIKAINQISIERYEAEIELTRINKFSEKEAKATSIGRETTRLDADFSPLDLIEELSENTALAYPTIVDIVKGLTNLDQLVRNPPRYLHLATEHINRIAVDEMVRTIDYRPTGEEYGFDLFQDVVETYRRTVATPNTGIYDHVILDAESLPESNFANEADRSPKVRALIKLPDWYKIPVPSLKGGSGSYTPDFGLVITDKGLRDDEEVELHLVVETKSTDKIDQLTPEEQVKIRCAIQHFQSLGISTNTTLRYKAPVTRFNPKVDEEQADYGGAPDPMGFFAPKNSFGLTLQEATANAEQENPCT